MGTAAMRAGQVGLPRTWRLRINLLPHRSIDLIARTSCRKCVATWLRGARRGSSGEDRGRGYERHDRNSFTIPSAIVSVNYDRSRLSQSRNFFVTGLLQSFVALIRKENNLITPQHILAIAASLRVRVNRPRCQGHARCVALAPELFKLDSMGDAHEIGDGGVSPDLEKNARLAWANCPERAIEIEQPGDSA